MISTNEKLINAAIGIIDNYYPLEWEKMYNGMAYHHKEFDNTPILRQQLSDIMKGSQND